MFLKQLPTTAVLFFLVTAPMIAKAASASDTIVGGLLTTNKEAGLPGPGTEGGNVSLAIIIGRIIQALLGVVGIIFLVLIVYSGYLYMTDGGEGSKMKKAKAIIGQSLIGLVIIVAAYAITSFVITTLGTAVAKT